jgi:hypothetical protein
VNVKNGESEELRTGKGYFQGETLQAQEIQGTQDRLSLRQGQEVLSEIGEEEQARSRIDGPALLSELNRRDTAYYRWSILALILSFLPFILAYPPWQFSGQFYASTYSNLGGFQPGQEPLVEVVRSVAVRVSLGCVSRFYFWLVATRDNVLYGYTKG